AEAEVRVWGRRRLLILERLLSVAKRFQVTLLGTGMPSFYRADLGDMSFTLGLSGWTKNDWSRVGSFDLMAPRAEVDAETQLRVFQALKENWLESPTSLAQRLHLDQGTVESALTAWAQAGRVIYDPGPQVYRVRELTQDPLPLDALRFSSPREEAANRILQDHPPNIQLIPESGDVLHYSAKVKDRKKTHQTEIYIDADQRLFQGSCTCNFFLQNKLYQGPCEHMLAIRMGAKHNKRMTST
ncbi:MAG: SWIM zinc finger family protein, partial [Verrucomicrobiota bacterium]